MKKTFTILLAAAAALAAAACSEIKDGVSDLDSWEIPDEKEDFNVYDPKVYTLSHPCMLHTADDIAYTKTHLGQEPWSQAYQKLLTSGFSVNTYKASPVKYLARLDANNWADGGGRWDDAGLRDEYYPGIHNNYTNFFRDSHAAYQLALKWQLSGDGEAAAAAIQILEDWAAVNKGLLLGRGPKWKDDVIDSNEYLIMFQMHQAANAAELLRSYNGWDKSAGFDAVKNWFITYFYPFCSKFIEMNNGDHWWMNWDLASMTAILSIGILADNQDMINEAILHFKHGEGPGCIMRKGIIEVFDDPDGTGQKLAQGNEAGRDQGHNTLCAAMVGAFCQMAYSIGEDLFAFEDGRAIAFAQYVAKYNVPKPEVDPNYESITVSNFRYLEEEMPFTEYTYNGGIMTAISGAGRGTKRPGWDIWAGYCNSHNYPAKYVTEMADFFRPDGGGGHYGNTSGGFDQLGFSTLMHYRPAN